MPPPPGRQGECHGGTRAQSSAGRPEAPQPPTKRYGDLPVEVHGLHHGLSCLLDRHLVLLAHCGEPGAKGQVRPPLPGPQKPPPCSAAPGTDRVPPGWWGWGGAAGRPPDRMMGSTSSYSRRAQIKSRARSCRSDIWGQRPPVTAHRRTSPLQPRSLPLGSGRPAVPQLPPDELRATPATLSGTGTYRAPARMGAAWTPTLSQAPSRLPTASSAAPGDVLGDSRAPLRHRPVSR